MKQKLKIIKLRFTSPLHISRGKADYYDQSEKFLHSDTIKSAIFSTMLLFEEDKSEENLKKLFDSFVVSSAFPFYNDLLFYPRPNYPTGVLTEKLFKVYEIDSNGEKKYLDPLDFAKDIKRTKFIEQSFFEKMIRYDQQEINRGQLYNGLLVPEEYALTTNSDSQCQKSDRSGIQISKNAPQDRVYIYKMEELWQQEAKGEKIKSSEPYRVDRIFFNDGAGLFFILDAKEEVFEKVIKAIEILQDFGLGTDRNVGNGQFDFDKDRDVKYIELDIPDEYNAVINLSLYWPQRNEVSAAITDRSFYSMIERGGYISNWLDQEFFQLLKRPVYMFEEGSIFPGFIKQSENWQLLVAGRYDDVRPYDKFEHPVFRDGRSIFLPLKIDENEL